MNYKHRFLILFLAIIFFQGNAQNTYDIDFKGNDRGIKCRRCLEIFNEAPNEMQFSIKREGDDLFFEINDKNWFKTLFSQPDDGLAIDIVSKERYSCNKESVNKNKIRGYLLKPLYFKNLQNGLKPYGENLFRVYVGSVPEAYNYKQLEFNILFLSNKTLCQYYTICDLESYPSELLDMGMFLDSLTYIHKEIRSTNNVSETRISNKTLKFSIPFEKNKSNYSQEDIKPIYNSLRLNNFNIKSINIKGYSSIEGRKNRNIELQELRAKSILNALQSFQKTKIKTKISTSENWVDFLNDIKGTKYEYLLSLSKTQIKTTMIGALSLELEPILKNHRKAVLELELENKDKFRKFSPKALLTKFNQAIVENKLTKAREVQNSIFEKLKEKKESPSILSKMNIPREERFIDMLNKNSAYRYLLNFRQAMIAYDELLDYEKLAPNNKKLKYNIVAIKLNLWRYNAIEVNQVKLKNQINALKSYGIDSSLVIRMMVNYHIILAEKLMRLHEYEKMDKSIFYINNNYNNFPLSKYDYLSLAQFFSYYADTFFAVKLLEEKANSVDIDENLLFYYLNLTIVDVDITNDLGYRAIMLNAINMNRARFCKLFNSVENGGVTFQLLEDDFLRETFCENCAD